MVAVGFPQKSTFGTLTATKIVCPEFDTVGGLAYFKVAGTGYLKLTTNRVEFWQHATLKAGINLKDSGNNVIIGTDDAGSIDDLAPITDADGVRTAIVNNPAGGIWLRDTGGNALRVTAGYVTPSGNLRIAATRVIEDIIGTILLDPDDVGQIAGLARLDGALTNPTGSQEVSLVPMELISPSQSGTLDEDGGFWYADATDSLYLYLNTIFNYLMSKGKVHIETITVYINTSAVGDYVTALTFNSYNVNSGAEDANVTDPTDIGNGSTGDEYGTLTVNTELASDRWHRLKVDAVVGTSFVSVRGIKIIYKLV